MPSLEPDFDQSNPSKLLITKRTGLSAPPGANTAGGIRLSSGETRDREIIVMSLLEASNSNPFQQDDEPIIASIFEINELAVQGRLTQKIESVFRAFELENRYQYLPETLSFERDARSGELNVTFQYHNLEVDRREDISVSIPTG